MSEHHRASPEVNFAKASAYNFLNGFGGPVWGAFAAYYGPLMALLGFLGASEFYNGVVNALFWFGFILTQIPAAYISERFRYKKWSMGIIFILAGTSEFVFAMALLLTGGSNYQLMLGLFLLCYGITTVISGAATPMIFSLLYKIIPQEKLGSWLGIYFLINSIGGILGGFVVKRILELGYPVAFEVLFTGTFLFGIGMALLVWLVKEPAGDLAPGKENFGVYLRHCITIIRTDRNLVRFFAGMWLVVGHYIVITFYSTYATTGGFGIEKAQTGAFVSMNLIGWMLASLGPLFIVMYPVNRLMKLADKEPFAASNIFSAGWIADRIGPKYTLITFQIVALGGVIICLFARTLPMFYIVWIFAGFAQICNNIGYTNMTMLSCPIEDKSTYVGLVNFAVFPLVVVVPMIFGALIGRGYLTYIRTFHISMALMVIAALYFMIFVENPEAYRTMKRRG